MSLMLIAESGGTKTDWCLIKNGVSQKRFRTSGLHPSLWTTDLWTDLEIDLKKHVDIASTELIFYGAGLLRENISQQLKNKFESIGFRRITVLSDLHAAGRALYNDEAGWVAIMGTGSVLFYYEGGEIRDIIGGKGHLKGDEGSGYYLGKLLFEDYRSGQMDDAQKLIMDNEIGEDRIKRLGLENKDEIARFSILLRDYQQEFDKYHRDNIASFYKSHIEGKIELDSLGIVGGYAFNHQKFILEELHSYNIEVQSFIEAPIERLIEQNVADN